MASTQTAVKHEQQCRRWMGIQKAKRTRFLRRYPNYCQACCACGLESYQDWEGLWDTRDCPECLGQDLCPRCMTPTIRENRDPWYTVVEHWYQTCTTCGWRGDDDYGDKYSLPREPICLCERS